MEKGIYMYNIERARLKRERIASVTASAWHRYLGENIYERAYRHEIYVRPRHEVQQLLKVRIFGEREQSHASEDEA